MFKHPDTYKHIQEWTIDWAYCPVCGTACWKYRYQREYTCTPCDYKWEEDDED